MNSKIIANGILRALLIVFGVFVVLFFLYKIQSVLIYLAVAAVLSLIGAPFVSFLTRKLKFSTALASVVSMLIMIGFLFLLALLFVPLVVEQSHNLALLDIEQLQENVESLYKEVLNYFEVKNIDLEQSIKQSNILSKIDFSLIPNFLNSVLSGMGSFSIGLFSVLFITFFFLKDNKLFENGVLMFIPTDKEKGSKRSFKTIKHLLSRYFVGLMFQILILFVIYTVVLLIVGIKNALVIAFLCALLNLIPYVGPLISAVLMILLSMSSNLGQSFSEVILPNTIYVMLGFVLAQLVDNFISQPVIFSKSVKSHPLEIFLVIIISGILFGIIGMVVAVPTYTAIKVILKEFLSENQVVKKLTRNL